MIIKVNYKVTNYDEILPVCVWVLHKLEIESGRFHIIPRENKLCKLCQQGVVESELHCLLCCNHYHTLRDKYFGNMSWPTIDKYNNIMSYKIRCFA